MSSVYPGVISYPIPVWQNAPIESDFYIPQMFFIENIILGKQTIVETTQNHNYVVGQQIRLLIPSQNGSYQLNKISGYVIQVLSQNSLLTDIDSSVDVSDFVTSSGNISSPQILAIGDINQGAINSKGRTQNKTFIPGSFINISPQ